MEKPNVTIGLPVFNGENFLSEAIESVLGQDYADFELIIRDNASTDGTAAICREACEKDSRIRYLRSETNVGAAPNFNAIVGDARGQYFKWLAHDDLMAPTFLSRCVERLEQDHTSVLACPRVRFIDAAGKPLEDYISPFRTADSDPVVRFKETLSGHPCYEVFGLIRLDELRKTRLIGSYKHGDGVLLSHLALLGRFAEIPQCLFLSRRHQSQSMYVYGVTNPDRKEDHDAYAQWFDARNTKTIPLNFTRRIAEYRWMIGHTSLRVTQRIALYNTLVGWSYSHRHRIKKEWLSAVGKVLGDSSAKTKY
ncbi:glycosyltransferase family 2 protein [Thiocapsa bogorovii]|uniref:glycosyltransferase family 2 protein n=1 Tax=Thiocapsa bogorovii TaxID=521689 RepID=UPI001E5A699D|nr:glycosyltransferase family 2 protein [Thiocapsa bogorovii]UHD17095.1 glycosyltransferase [Thiocapsa bogorovii]